VDLRDWSWLSSYLFVSSKVSDSMSGAHARSFRGRAIDMIILITMTKTLTALKARQNLGEVLEEVYYKGDQYIIERAGKPMAAIVPLWQIQERSQLRARLFQKIQSVWDANRTVKPEIVEREVAEAVAAVRGARPKTKPVRRTGRKKA